MPSFVLDLETERFRRRFAGNITFYQFLDKYRAPYFLARNIRKALSYHRLRVYRARTGRGDKNMASRAHPSPPSSRSPVVRNWDPKEIQQIIDAQSFTDRDPFLRLDVRAIRDYRKSYKPLTPFDSPERPVKQARTETTRALCALTIWEGHNVILVRDTVYCTVRSQPRMDTGERYAKVELDKPFKVYLQQLVPKKEQGPTAQRYSMQLTLTAAQIHGRWPPIHLDKVPAPQNVIDRDVDGEENRFPFLVASYSRLPQCPSKDEEALLPILVLQDHKQLKPKLNLEIDAKWLEPMTPLETYNAHFRFKEAQDKKHRALSSGAPEETVTTAAMPDAEVIWKIQDENIEVEEHTFHGYVCPLCNNRRFEGSDFYWFHLVQNHDNFRFRVQTRMPDNANKGSCIKVIVKVDIKDQYETKPGRRIGPEDTFLESHPAPLTPQETQALAARGYAAVQPMESCIFKTYSTFFDLEQYLREDAEKQWPKAAQKVDQAPLLDTASRSVSFMNSSRATPSILDRNRLVEDVPDIPSPQRKKFPVPPAPDGVTFFSLRVKRPLQDGEMLSESDDDVVDDWILQKHNDKIDSYKDLTAEEKSFIKRHDKHMLRENISSNLHYRDALVRFCRLNRRWLRQIDARREFAKKLTALQLEGIVKSQQVIEYFRIIDDTSQDDVAISGEDAQLDEFRSTLSPNKFIGPLHAICETCGCGIQVASEVLRCNNAICMNDYHRKCVEGGSNADGDIWRCVSCRDHFDLREYEDLSDHLSDLTESDEASMPAVPKNGPNIIGLSDPSKDSAYDLLDRFADDPLTRLPSSRGSSTLPAATSSSP